MPINYSRIPAELQALPQYVVWRLETRPDSDKPTKIPYNPITGRHASVTDPMTWCTFEQAVHAAIVPGSTYSGIGLVLTENDPYCFVDLDAPKHYKGTPEEIKKLCDLDINRQLRIYNEMNSYSERSPSGNGLHIIVKASVPTGRKRGCIEIYSQERYMTMTGDVFRDAPIEDRTNEALVLWDQMGAGSPTGEHRIVSQPQIEDDAAVFHKASNAANGGKFLDLHAGEWQKYYTSQSEGDYAYINIIAHYTKNFEQIVRMFRDCALGLRPKAKRMDYVMKMVYNSFDRMLPPVDIIDVQDRFEIARNEKEIVTVGVNEGQDHEAAIALLRELHTPSPICAPPGLVGDIMQYVYQSSPRPVGEMALCAGLGLMAGVCGRQWNISGTGLNLYLLLLAMTGTGKEAMATGINNLMTTVADCTRAISVPAAQKFLGPGDFASGQALVKHFDQHPDQLSFLSIFGEFGFKMQQITSPRASGSDLAFMQQLLNLYQKSGEGSVLADTSAAKKENSATGVKSPAFSMLAESTPEIFYEVISEDNIKSGLLSRFITLEYTGPRVPFNENHRNVKPTPELIDKLVNLCTMSLNMQRNDTVCEVAMTDEAREFFAQVELLTTNVINHTKKDALRDLWNRAHLKTMKLAALVAVGIDYMNPVVDLNCAKWAYNIVSTDIMALTARFRRGDIGRESNESEQAQLVHQRAIEFLERPFKEVAKYSIPKAIHTARMVPYSYLSRTLLCNKLLKKHKHGPTKALKDALAVLVASGDLAPVGKGTLLNTYKYAGECYVVMQFPQRPHEVEESPE